MRIRRSHPLIEPSRFRINDLGSEALAGLVQRPARTALTMFGTVLGVGAFVAILGLTSTASGQISSAFSTLSATQVSVSDVGDANTAQTNDTGVRYDFPDDAEQRVGRLNGVVADGIWWNVVTRGSVLTVTPNPATSVATTLTNSPIPVYAVSPTALTAMGPTLETGRLYDAFAESRKERVVVLSDSVARRLGITSLDRLPAVFINGTAYLVVGIVSDLQRQPDLLLGVMIPASTAEASFGQPTVGSPAQMLIQTRLGAAQVVASQAALALSAEHPDYFTVTPPPDPHALRDHVAGALNTLFLLLAGITLVIGAVGIANTTLISVLERTGEIGLRRSLGARPRHVATQFLTESIAIGALGGLIGTALGVGVVVAVALIKDWTAILNPASVIPAPLIGAVVGLIAGTYPALRAAQVEPVEALRR